MAALRDSGLEQPVRDAVASGRPFLGVCIGTQMLFDDSEEAKGVPGMGVIAGSVRRLAPGVKLPQMQWNRIDVARRRRADVRRPRRPAVVLLRPLPPCGAGRSRRGRGDVRVRRRGQRRLPGRERVRHPVPPGEVGRCRTAAARQLRRGSPAPHDGTRCPSCTRPSTCGAGEWSGCAQGDFAAETVYGDDPVCDRDRRSASRGRDGSTSSISTPPAAVNHATVSW